MADLTLVDTVQRQARERPQDAAIRCADRVLSFADLDRESSRVAAALGAIGVGRGDRVACLTQHHIECLLLMLGACKLGAVCVPVNWRLAAGEVAYVLGHSEAVFLLADAGFLSAAAGAPLPRLRWVVCTERTEGAALSFADWCGEHAACFTPVELAADDDALQLYSSGTTGLPKGVVLTHRGLLSTCETVAGEWGFGAGDVNGNPLPTFHVAGMTMLLLTVFAGGRTVAFPSFDPAAFIDAIGSEGITHAFLVPAMLLFMLQQPNVRRGDYRGLRLIAYGGSPISERLLIDSIAAFGCDFLQVYGLTEVSGPVTFLMPDEHRRALSSPAHVHLLRSAGRAAAGAALRVVDPVSGSPLREGEVGEIWIESIRNLKAYWRDAEATERAFPEGRGERGGWFRSGDAGYLREGLLTIHDRIKDMIVTGGENVYPAEVENALLQHPAVADAAVIGVPDETWGESVKACIVIKPGAQVEAAAIIEFMRARLAHYKCPRSIDVLAELPRNPGGKLLKRVLREPFWKDRSRAVN